METLTLLATIPAILALTNLAKSFGVNGKWSALLAVVLGVMLSVADYLFLGEVPLAATAAGVYIAAGTGAILGLTAAGLYDVATTIGSKPAEVQTFGEIGRAYVTVTPRLGEPEAEVVEDAEPRRAATDEA